MKLAIKKRDIGKETKEQFRKEELELAYEFTNRLYKELGEFLRAVVLFGSSARKEKPQGKEHDIDLLIIVDDVTMILSPEVIETYRIIVEKTVTGLSPRLHITSLKFTSFWEYVRAGDPVAVNILRDGMPLLDTGFFKPLKVLLHEGRVRPSPESVWGYFSRAPRTLNNAKWHMMQATLDLYWAVIDSAHAALMHLNEIPPSPEHVADLLEKRMVKKKLLTERYVRLMRKFYDLSKKIVYRDLKEMEGAEFDSLYKEAHEFVSEMKRVIEKTPAGK